MVFVTDVVAFRSGSGAWRGKVTAAAADIHFGGMKVETRLANARCARGAGRYGWVPWAAMQCSRVCCARFVGAHASAGNRIVNVLPTPFRLVTDTSPR